MRSFIPLIFCLLGILPCKSQIFNRPVNLWDENGLRKGLWVAYWDEENKIPMSKATYENGREVGISKQYHTNGILRLKFRYQHDRIRVKYYTDDRKLEQKGWSVIDYNEKDIHYYWHGKWKFFDEERKLTRISYYQNGAEVMSSETEQP
jgi:antitoxin component YwqK of YwqJK toxin-antitoxin module